MKRFSFVVFAVATVFIVASCGSGASAKVAADPVSDYIEEMRGKTPGNAMWGIGVGDHSYRHLRRTQAEQRARNEIARQVEVFVQNRVRDFTRGSSAEQRALIQATDDISKAIAEQALRGSRVKHEKSFGAEQVMVMEITVETLRSAISSASQSVATIAPHLASMEWAFVGLDADLAQMRDNPVIRRND